MHDAHTHIQDQVMIEYLKQNDIKCIVNASNVEEYEFLKKHQYGGMFISCGVHPWYVETTDYDRLKEYIQKADFLGEIGLDEPWCETSFDLQKEILLQQLQTFQKPTILHTKGYEKEVLDIIRLFPRKYLVHWYSCNDFIDDYIQLDCFFTVGPSVGLDETVNEVVRKVPLHRLLIETDGLEALEWAMNKKIDIKDYRDILNRTVQMVANIKKQPINEVKYILNKNFEALTCN